MGSISQAFEPGLAMWLALANKTWWICHLFIETDPYAILKTHDQEETKLHNQVTLVDGRHMARLSLLTASH